MHFGFGPCESGFNKSYSEALKVATGLYLPLLSSEWKNGSNSSYNCAPFLHSLLTKGKYRGCCGEHCKRVPLGGQGRFDCSQGDKRVTILL